MAKPERKGQATLRQPEPRPAAPPKRGAQQHRVQFADRSRSWRRHHLSVAREALLRLKQTPIASLMTLAVLAIALALPGFLLAALGNLQGLTNGWEPQPRISLYMQTDLSDEAIDRFSRELLLREDLNSVELISRQKGLEEFREYSAFADLLDSFEDNPLPAVIMVLPRDTDPLQLPLLRSDLAALPGVEEAALDMEWVQRLDAILMLAGRGSYVLGGLLALAVLLVVGNTVRMTIESRRDEILVSKLVGATDAWVRRPFLYSGFWFGLLGGVLAWLLVQLALLMLAQPAQALASLYLTDFALQGLGLGGSLTMLASAVVLGLAGSWLAVSRHLRDIDPGAVAPGAAAPGAAAR
ncbi:permease-like cell division protein FtsX [Marinobacterium weihaiense]|uniref:Cell division protein FtsX n=1 Tax=Marinobacterium weihaiense TaxID=2851016 RepID=A0ABS6MA96_9GAMM|nr:permease-like cell division protein FtsX [Marinobacterium weihaiense]MBV0933203.1 permease-like cell division protein FtsX [Marinobacterium weihaiense]